MRIVAPRFFAVLGVPVIAGRDFTDDDRRGAEPVSIVSETIARRLFPNGEAVGKHLTWTDPVFDIFGKRVPSRIVGVVADVDDESVVPRPVLTVYQPVWQLGVAGRLFVHTAGDPYALAPEVRRVIHEISAEQPVERAATLEDVRAEVLSPDRLNAFVFSGFAGIALLVAVVGVAGVLAFSVAARTREFGVRSPSDPHACSCWRECSRRACSIAAIGIAAARLGLPSRVSRRALRPWVAEACCRC
jgi:ABC-type antimicrobial peptide transport system permease subunit